MGDETNAIQFCGKLTAVPRREERFISRFPFILVRTGTRMKSSSMRLITFQSCKLNILNIDAYARTYFT